VPAENSGRPRVAASHRLCSLPNPHSRDVLTAGKKWPNFRRRLPAGSGAPLQPSETAVQVLAACEKCCLRLRIARSNRKIAFQPA